MENILYKTIKRIIDIIAGFLGIVILAVASVIIKIIYIINKDYANIIYKQKRVGKNGKIIYVYKFRTMVPDAEEKLKLLLLNEKYKEEWDKFQKLENDPRIVPYGESLRKFAFDELPQVLNLVKGDMSIVGPRPLVPGELEAHSGNRDIYTKEAETADMYIEKFAHENASKYQVTVATSDGLEQIIIRGKGCFLLSARDLWEEMMLSAKKNREEFLEKQETTKNYLFDHLDEHLAEHMEKLRKGE